MPRLGNEAGPGDHQPIANAYSPPNRQLSLGNIALLLFGAFTIRNILFHDYRSEEVDLLKASGQTEDQIDALFVPRTAYERRKKLIDDAAKQEEDMAQMKKDIEFLKEEVKVLRNAAGIPKAEEAEKEKASSRL